MITFNQTAPKPSFSTPCRVLLLQALEREKRLIHQLPLDQLDALQARRAAAATTIQAHWRGGEQRQRLRLTVPALVSGIQWEFCTEHCTVYWPEICRIPREHKAPVLEYSISGSGTTTERLCAEID